MIWPFLLYLRVSGQFHVIVGMLHLFGFNLPETHHEYFLSSSFTDFWRRINIYWKDFMTKLFYYPAYFALRKQGEAQAIVLSTLARVCHDLDSPLVSVVLVPRLCPSGLERCALLVGARVLVVVNDAVRAASRKATHARHARAHVEKHAGGDGATLAMFAAICILWSLWSTDSLRTWLSLWSAATRWPSTSPPWVLALLLMPLTVGLWVVVKSRSWWRGLPAGLESTAAGGRHHDDRAGCEQHRHGRHATRGGRAFFSATRYGGLNRCRPRRPRARLLRKPERRPVQWRTVGAVYESASRLGEGHSRIRSRADDRRHAAMGTHSLVVRGLQGRAALHEQLGNARQGCTRRIRLQAAIGSRCWAPLIPWAAASLETRRLNHGWRRA